MSIDKLKHILCYGAIELNDSFLWYAEKEYKKYERRKNKLCKEQDFEQAAFCRDMCKYLKRYINRRKKQIRGE